MSKKQYFITIDTETTMGGKVADIAGVVTDRQGKIYAQFAVLVAGVYDNRENDPLFFNEASGDLWNKASLDKRYNKYNGMLAKGERMLSSVKAINHWLQTAAAHYNPSLTAYNLAFDKEKCKNTGIDLSIFTSEFCLWHVSCEVIVNTRKYKQFILDNHFFKPPTKHGNMSFSTNAETMTRYVTNQPDLEDEPHTALEDVLYYEVPVLNYIVKRRSLRKILDIKSKYNWRNYQVKNFFKVA